MPAGLNDRVFETTADLFGLLAAPACLRIVCALVEGERRLGPFRLLHKLGQGGFAPVWLAEEAYEGKRLRDVAVKLFFQVS